MKDHIENKLEFFRSRVEQDKTRYMQEHKYSEWQFNSIAKTVVKMGKKFAKVDVGESGKYMVDLATGEIFGIKAYGVVHRGHRYGTLDTVEEWDWREYTAFPKQLINA